VRLHDDDPAFLGPNLLEEQYEQLASLGWSGLELPEAGEVFEQGPGAVDRGIGRRGESLQLFLDRLAAHDVSGLGEVAHEIELAEAVEPGEQLASAMGRLGRSLAAVGGDGLHHQLEQVRIGLEVA